MMDEPCPTLLSSPEYTDPPKEYTFIGAFKIKDIFTTLYTCTRYTNKCTNQLQSRLLCELKELNIEVSHITTSRESGFQNINDILELIFINFHKLGNNPLCRHFVGLRRQRNDQLFDEKELLAVSFWFLV